MSTFDWLCCDNSPCNYAVDQDDDGCFDIAIPVAVTYLSQITQTSIPDCNGIEVTLDGGYPEFFSDGVYSIYQHWRRCAF